jgi:hypothetical protein
LGDGESQPFPHLCRASDYRPLPEPCSRGLDEGAIGSPHSDGVANIEHRTLNIERRMASQNALRVFHQSNIPSIRPHAGDYFPLAGFFTGFG